MNTRSKESSFKDKNKTDTCDDILRMIVVVVFVEYIYFKLIEKNSNNKDCFMTFNIDATSKHNITILEIGLILTVYVTSCFDTIPCTAIRILQNECNKIK